MPIISFYGARARTGRTTAAVAIARGLAKLGRRVTLVEISQRDITLEQWFAGFDHDLLGSGSLDFHHCESSDGLDSLLRLSPPDDRHVIIFDTDHLPSRVRIRAFEMADAVIMPFRCFEDADIGIASASSQLPTSTHLSGLSVGAPTHLSKQVANWMPLIKPGLPLDERLTLHLPLQSHSD